MPIEFHPESGVFFLHSAHMTYAMRIHEFGCLCHLYWGPPLRSQPLDFLLPIRPRAFSPNPAGAPQDFSLNDFPLEYPVYGNSDFRSPALEVRDPSEGSRIVDLRYLSHSIEPGKPGLQGLPATFAANEDSTTLRVRLRDQKLGLTVELLYTVFQDTPALARSATLIHEGSTPLEIKKALSSSVDFSSACENFDFVHLSGNWIRERNISVSPLHPGTQSVESRRGTSSHQHNPFYALAESGASEEHGRVFGFNLVYSGNFVAAVELDEDGRPRAQIGLNPFDFTWRLSPGESFQTPEAILVFSNEGLGGMSRSFHRLYRDHLCRSTFQHRHRPVLLNSWEGTYFDFDAEKLVRIAADAKELGIELFVLDDGWFGHRNAADCSLGDWTVDRRKIPKGLTDLARRINGEGVEFGLWFEPEMVSPDSDLYRQHPDWCLHVAGRPRTEGRAQLILDYSRHEVWEEIYRQIAVLLREAPITYVKWDMNRHLTELSSAALPPERQQEVAHRYVLGLYAMLDRFLEEFPHVLIEGCSGGGGRYDPGMLYYMPQIWTSDNSDAIARLKIQFGTSLAYPLSTMAAHVSIVPNHQVNRTTPFRTRGTVALTGAFGYELDLQLLTEEEKLEVRRQISFFHEMEPLLHSGDLYRLLSPFTGNAAAWMVVSRDRKEALVSYVNILAEPNPATRFLPLRGLDPELHYSINNETHRPGDGLMQIGLPLPFIMDDFTSSQWLLRAL